LHIASIAVSNIAAPSDEKVVLKNDDLSARARKISDGRDS
jgi:hypothetical protein